MSFRTRLSELDGRKAAATVQTWACGFAAFGLSLILVHLGSCWELFCRVTTVISNGKRWC